MRKLAKTRLLAVGYVSCGAYGWAGGVCCKQKVTAAGLAPFETYKFGASTPSAGASAVRVKPSFSATNGWIVVDLPQIVS